MERNELQQMDASSETRADLMLLTDLFWAANPTANTFSRRITETRQSCSIIPFADNRTIFGTIFLFFKKKLFWSLTFLYRARLSAKQEAENTDTRKSRAQAYLILKQSWGVCGRICALVAAVAGCFALVALRVRSRSACAHHRSRQVTSGYYCTVQTVRTEETFCSGWSRRRGNKQ